MGGKLMIYDEKGRGYTSDQIAALVGHLNNSDGPVNWAALAGELTGKNIILKNELERLKEAGRKVLAARDPEDEPIGHPGHCHAMPGVWDRDSSPCQECAAYNTLAALCGEA